MKTFLVYLTKNNQSMVLKIKVGYRDAVYSIKISHPIRAVIQNEQFRAILCKPSLTSILAEIECSKIVDSWRVEESEGWMSKIKKIFSKLIKTSSQGDNDLLKDLYSSLNNYNVPSRNKIAAICRRSEVDLESQFCQLFSSPELEREVERFREGLNKSKPIIGHSGITLYNYANR